MSSDLEFEFGDWGLEVGGEVGVIFEDGGRVLS